MQIPLREDWQTCGAKLAHQVYPIGTKERELIDQQFDTLAKDGKLEFCKDPTPFAFPVFVAWRTMYSPDGTPIRKGRVVVDIRGLNKACLSDTYPMPNQGDIIQMVSGKGYISLLDMRTSFYQYLVATADRNKLSVTTHRGLERFLVAVMGYKGSPPYEQRIHDELFRDYQIGRAHV